MTAKSLVKGLRVVVLAGVGSALSFGAFAETAHSNQDLNNELRGLGISWYPSDTGKTPQSQQPAKDREKAAARETKAKQARKTETKSGSSAKATDEKAVKDTKSTASGG